MDEPAAQQIPQLLPLYTERTYLLNALGSQNQYASERISMIHDLEEQLLDPQHPPGTKRRFRKKIIYFNERLDVSGRQREAIVARLSELTEEIRGFERTAFAELQRSGAGNSGSGAGEICNYYPQLHNHSQPHNHSERQHNRHAFSEDWGRPVYHAGDDKIPSTMPTSFYVNENGNQHFPSSSSRVHPIFPPVEPKTEISSPAINFNPPDMSTHYSSPLLPALPTSSFSLMTPIWSENDWTPSEHTSNRHLSLDRETRRPRSRYTISNYDMSPPDHTNHSHHSPDLSPYDEGRQSHFSADVASQNQTMDSTFDKDMSPAQMEGSMTQMEEEDTDSEYEEEDTEEYAASPSVRSRRSLHTPILTSFPPRLGGPGRAGYQHRRTASA